MVGGTVIGLARGPESTLVHVQDTGDYKHDRCSVRVTEKRKDTGESVQIGLGDSVWWQSGEVMWTPLAVKEAGIDWGVDCGKAWDIALPKIGYSH
jgi:hypothetical protein